MDCGVEGGSWMDDYFPHCDVDMDLSVPEVDRGENLGRTYKGLVTFRNLFWKDGNSNAEEARWMMRSA